LKVLVTGATGHVGAQVVAQLTAAGVPVHPFARGLGGDLRDPSTLPADVTAAFLLWPFTTAAGVQPVVDHLAAHVAHVVVLSAMNAGAGHWGEVEDRVAASGVGWTFLRPGGFAANTLGWADQVRTGVVHWPYGAAARSLIHEADIAAVAVRALTTPGHRSQRYELTGPAAITQAEQVAAIGAAIGREVRWAELPPAAARAQLLTEWGDPAFVDGALAYWATLVDHPEPVTHTVEQVTGVPARTFAQWAADHRVDFGGLPV